jgi:hypothetical protein
MPLEVLWRKTNKGIKPYIKDGSREKEAVWAPQPGSQLAFLSCPVDEALYEGTRGPGKTDALLMDFAQDVGVGWGAAWRGIIFRRTFPELRDLISKSLRWFKLIFPNANYNQSGHFWTFPGGEQLYFGYFDSEDDYWKYHGFEFPWIAWEELTTWPNLHGYHRMKSCWRSSNKDVPRRYRATTNPYGVGHNAVKSYFGLPVGRGQIIGPIIIGQYLPDGSKEPDRVAIHGMLDENKILLDAEPDYKAKIRAAARNEQELKAWLYGDWNIVAGGMLDDIWRDSIHVVPSFPFNIIPKAWRIDRSYDHGQSKPFSVGWWAESNGEPFRFEGRNYGVVKGDLFRIAEWYGWNGKPNEGCNMLSREIGRGILDREDDYGIAHRVRVGSADASIFDRSSTGESSVADEMIKVGNARGRSLRWEACDKSPGSRIQGWQLLRARLKNSASFPREYPGLYVCERCYHFRRTVPVLPRDHRNLDDVDTEFEDHLADETRYRVRHQRKTVHMGDMK